MWPWSNSTNLAGIIITTVLFEFSNTLCITTFSGMPCGNILVVLVLHFHTQFWHHHICFSFSVRFSNNNDTRYALGETLFTAYKQTIFWRLLLFCIWISFLFLEPGHDWFLADYLFIYLVDCRSSPLILWAYHSFRLTLL